MWIVRFALQRPYTFVIVALLIAIFGVTSILTTPTDILPAINIPIVSVIWTYSGLDADDMSKRIIGVCERALPTTVNNIQYTESQSYSGVGVIKIYFQPNVQIDLAIAQVTALAQSLLRLMPPGILPPYVLKYDASSVPIVQVSLGGKGLSQTELYDLGQNFIRGQLATIKGAAVPLPYGGEQRAIMVDLEPVQLAANHMTASDVSAALANQNLVTPSGTQKMGDREYLVGTNSSPGTIAELNSLPIRAVNGAVVQMKDVAWIHNGYQPQTSYVSENGQASALLTVIKSGASSTLTIVDQVKAAIPRIKAGLPSALTLTPIFDQSVLVRASIRDVVQEAVTAAFLTALMVLVFLGSWRSTLIVSVSIPLAALFAIAVSSALGETINVMSLGGLALAVGMLVDDATVEIENTHRNLGLGQKKPLATAILDSAEQVATPALISTMSICIVFVPVTLLSGSAKYIFTPLALNVVLALIASYGLSRTLVPTMMQFLLAKEHGQRPRWAEAFERGFNRVLGAYGRALDAALARRPLVIGLGISFAVASAALFPLLGKDFFPAVDGGQFRLHVRGPAGMRLEETQKLFAQVEDHIHKLVPAGELDGTIDDIGVPVSGINLALGDPSMISTADGEILVSLKAAHHPTAAYVSALRKDLRASFPQETFFFLPADIATQTLNFGLSAPIDVQITGPTSNQDQNLAIANELVRQISAVPGAADVHRAQVVATPSIRLQIDRTLSDQVGLTQRNVTSDLLVSLSSSGQTSPNFWLDPKKGVQYLVAVQTPQYKLDSLDSLNATPLTGGKELLGNVADISRTTTATNITHYNVAPTFDVQANVEGRDLGSVSAAISRIVGKTQLPRGTTINVIGQAQSMNASFRGLELGLLFAVLLVYLLMVVNFQSWLDPLIILTALPGAIAGIAWMLFVTGTRLSVPALMGAMMTVGVATANSILMVTFANERRAEGATPLQAALLAGKTRLRPVMMTALAMIIGMLPMALSLGEGGEQNAPLGRAVIGGLLLATLSTLFFVPAMYSVMRKGEAR